jgi:hypothetical protein
VPHHIFREIDATSLGMFALFRRNTPQMVFGEVRNASLRCSLGKTRLATDRTPRAPCVTQRHYVGSVHKHSRAPDSFALSTCIPEPCFYAFNDQATFPVQRRQTAEIEWGEAMALPIDRSRSETTMENVRPDHCPSRSARFDRTDRKASRVHERTSSPRSVSNNSDPPPTRFILCPILCPPYFNIGRNL